MKISIKPHTARLCRYICLNIIRVLSLVLILLGIPDIFGFGIEFYQVYICHSGYFYDYRSMNGGVFVTIARNDTVWYLISGIILGIVSRKLSQWIFPYPEYRCLGCGYSLEKMTAGRCPECGRVERVDDAS